MQLEIGLLYKSEVKKLQRKRRRQCRLQIFPKKFCIQSLEDKYKVVDLQSTVLLSGEFTEYSFVFFKCYYLWSLRIIDICIRFSFNID